ncbi:MAG: hypothetical protein ACK5LL_00765 [Suipraeoptans sp.]
MSIRISNVEKERDFSIRDNGKDMFEMHTLELEEIKNMIDK